MTRPWRWRTMWMPFPAPTCRAFPARAAAATDYVQIALMEHIDNLIDSVVTDLREILDCIIEFNDALEQ